VSSEESLVRDCAAGSPEAWAAFVEGYSDWILRCARTALRRMGAASEADAEDTRSDVFRQLLERDRAMLRSLRPPYNLRAWLAIVARRACGKLLRSRRPPPPPRPGPSKGDSDLLDLLDRLPAEDRLILQLFFIHESSYEEIAAILGMSAESVGKAKFRALEKLRRLQSSDAGL